MTESSDTWLEYKGDEGRAVAFDACEVAIVHEHVVTKAVFVVTTGGKSTHVKAPHADVLKAVRDKQAAARGGHATPAESPPSIDVVFDGPPGPDGPRFVEVEVDGASVNIGEWLERPDGFWALRIPLTVATGPL